MKTYFEFIEFLREATAVKSRKKTTTKSGGTATKSATKRKVAEPTLRPFPKTSAPSREPYPWVSRGVLFVGWWHPTREWLTLSRQYHVGQIAATPSKFGITPQEVDDGIAKYADWVKHNDSYRRVGLGYDDPHKVKDAIMQGKLDLCYHLQMVAYSKGWLKVYGGRMISIEGTDRASLKKAMDEIEITHNFEKPDMELHLVGDAPGKETYKRIDSRNWDAVRREL